MPDSLLISLSALQAQQRAMEVTSHNIANANTPGYTRQRADLAAKSPEDVKPGMIGRGVDLTAIRRLSDSLVDSRLRQSDGESGRLKTLKDNLLTVQQTFNEPGDNGISASIGRLFSSLEDLSNNPESKAIRATAVQEISTFAAGVSDLGKQLLQQRDDIATSVSSSLDRVNALTASIAGYNQAIRSQVNLGQNPNDLMDRRETDLRELTGLIDARVHTNSKDQSVTIDLNGQLLVAPGGAQVLSMIRFGNGDISVQNASGFANDIPGGSIGALLDLHKNQLPNVISAMDNLTSTFVREMNGINATGTSSSFLATAFISQYGVPLADAGANLDDVVVRQNEAGQIGIPKAFAPVFTDASGAQVSRDLTINVFDTVSKAAVKSVIRWDPTVGGGTRSLNDLIKAINTGSGGGFSVFPPGSLGIPGVSASKVEVDGGYRLQIESNSDTKSIDFSAALDANPAAQAWTGTGNVTVSGTSTVAIGGTRIQGQVNATGTGVVFSYRSVTDGSQVLLGSAGVGAGPVTFGGITVDVAAGSYRAGDTFGVALTGIGVGAQVIDPATGLAGTQTQKATWAAGDATIQFKGRYTNTLSDPSKPWSVSVINPGVVGAKAGTAAPNNPPVVQFTYWTGTPGAMVRQTLTKTLDSTLPANTPIQLADGVYATVSAGTLSTAGNRLETLVDGAPDQAGLLPALGINSLFSGGESAATLGVVDRLVKDPSQLGVAGSRNEGDNANVKAFLDLRRKPAFDGGKFAIDDSYQGIVTSLGVKIQQSTRLGDNQEALKAALEHQRQSISGVNIDEEVGALILQQQAYSAAARVVNAAKENIQTLLQMMN